MHDDPTHPDPIINETDITSLYQPEAAALAARGYTTTWHDSDGMARLDAD